MVHQVSISLFRLIASIVRNPSFAAICALSSFLVMLLFGGFLLPQCKNDLQREFSINEITDGCIKYYLWTVKWILLILFFFKNKELCLNFELKRLWVFPCCSFSTWLVRMGVLAFPIRLCRNSCFSQWIPFFKMAKGGIPSIKW